MLEVYCWLPLVGVGLHSLSSPWFGLMIWLEWHTAKLCDSNLDIGNTRVNWGPSCLKHCPDHLWVPGHFTDLDLWSLLQDQQIHCRLRQSVPPSLAIVGIGVARSSSVHPPSPMAPVSGTIWSAAGTVTLPCSCQGSHHPGYLVSQLRGSFNRRGGHS